MGKVGFWKILVSSAAIIVFLALSIFYIVTPEFIPKGALKSVLAVANFLLLILTTRYLLNLIKEDKFTWKE